MLKVSYLVWSGEGIDRCNINFSGSANYCPKFLYICKYTCTMYNIPLYNYGSGLAHHTNTVHSSTVHRGIQSIDIPLTKAEIF